MHHKEKHIQQILYGKYTADNKPLIKNKKHLEDTIKYAIIRKEVDKVNTNTIDADLIAIYHLSEFLKDKPFQNATRQDIRDLSNHLKEILGNSESTTNLYLMKIKRFYKYISEPDKYENGKNDQKDIRYPDSVRWITYNTDDGDLPLESLLSEKEIKKMLDSCKDIRDQVILVSLLDGGLRKSELISLKVGNVGFDRKLGAYFLLPKKSKNNGLKTGMRKIQLFLIPSSTPYIKEYLNRHRFKDDPNAPFIYSEDPTGKSNTFSIGEMGITEIINRIVKTSGIKKHITPHILRHNSCTMCCKKGFNEHMLRERYGWSKRSKMPSRYVHLANVDMDNKIKQILGIKDEETPEDSILQKIICWNCQEENPCSHRFCWRCGASLKPKKEELTPTAIDTGIVTQEAIQDPEFRDFYNEMLVKTWKMYKEMKTKQK